VPTFASLAPPPLSLPSATRSPPSPPPRSPWQLPHPALLHPLPLPLPLFPCLQQSPRPPLRSVVLSWDGSAVVLAGLVPRAASRAPAWRTFPSTRIAAPPAPQDGCATSSRPPLLPLSPWLPPQHQSPHHRPPRLCPRLPLLPRSPHLQRPRPPQLCPRPLPLSHPLSPSRRRVPGWGTSVEAVAGPAPRAARLVSATRTSRRTRSAASMPALPAGCATTKSPS
jgi:hypothetical protein